MSFDSEIGSYYWEAPTLRECFDLCTFVQARGTHGVTENGARCIQVAYISSLSPSRCYPLPTTCTAAGPDGVRYFDTGMTSAATEMVFVSTRPSAAGKIEYESIGTLGRLAAGSSYVLTFTARDYLNNSRNVAVDISTVLPNATQLPTATTIVGFCPQIPWLIA